MQETAPQPPPPAVAPAGAAARLLGIIEKASAAVAALIIFALMILVVADVAGRKLFNAPVHGTIEIAALTLPTIVFLSIAYIQSLREHVAVDLFTAGLSLATRQALDLFALTVALAIMAVITWKTSAFAWSSWLDGEYAMGIVPVPIWPARVAVAYGCWLLTIRLAFDLVGTAAALAATRRRG